MNPFKRGDRIKYSAEGLHALNPTATKKDRLGIVNWVSNSDPELVYITWDGTLTPQSFHHSFLTTAGAASA